MDGPTAASYAMELVRQGGFAVVAVLAVFAWWIERRDGQAKDRQIAELMALQRTDFQERLADTKIMVGTVERNTEALKPLGTLIYQLTSREMKP